MPTYNLSHTRTRISQAIPSHSISLLSIVESSPEPTATVSGVVPGQALLDDQVPTTEAVSEPKDSSRRYPQRPRFSTKAIEQYNKDRAQVRENSKNSKPRKPRKKSSASSLVSAVSEQTTTNDAPDSEPSAPGDTDNTMGRTTASWPGGEGEDATDVPRLRLEAAAMQQAPGEQVQHIHASGSAAPGMDRIKGRGDVPCSPSGAADPTSERDRDPAR
ncbi:hypothetical protein FRC08_017816, partial [Ceratobasidium sp. 394]